MAFRMSDSEQPAFTSGHDPVLNEGPEGLQIATAKLLKEMKRTKGVRFNASKRLERKDTNLTAAAAWASVGVIVLTLLPVYLTLPPFIVAVINIITVGFSIAILALTLLQANNGDKVKAEQFQRCALEINSLRRELRGTNVSDSAILLSFSKRYDEILGRYSINHDDVDLEKYRLEHPDEFPPDTPAEREILRKDLRRSYQRLGFLANTIGAMTAAVALTAILVGGAGEIITQLAEQFLTMFRGR
jgi:hypothetical protein